MGKQELTERSGQKAMSGKQEKKKKDSEGDEKERGNRSLQLGKGGQNP